MYLSRLLVLLLSALRRSQLELTTKACAATANISIKSRLKRLFFSRVFYDYDFSFK